MSSSSEVKFSGHSLLMSHKRPPESTGCCGRKFTLCNCCSTNKLFIITTVVGALFLALGLLAFGGHFASTAGGNLGTILQKINEVATFVAAKLGSDLFTIATFTTAMGAAFTALGSVGLCVNKCAPKEVKGTELNSTVWDFNLED